MLRDFQIKRGDILWLKQPQTLSPLDVARDQPFKIRPFIALNAQLSVKVNHNDECTQDRTLFGVGCTSKPYLVEGRPHIAFEIPGSGRVSYAFLDSVRDIETYGQKLRRPDHLTPNDEEQLLEGLRKVLKPEQRFFLTSLFNAKTKCMPGEIWRVKSIDADGEAMVLLRRGKFVASADIEDSSAVDPRTQRIKYAPYLVAYFKRATGVTNLKGITWNDIRIMALNENSFMEKTAGLSRETTGILLNNIRARVGLPSIEYNEPAFKHMLNIGALLRFASPFGRSLS